MRKLSPLALLLLFISIGSCDVLGSGDDDDSFEYRFKTNESTYGNQDTVNATFINRSDKTIYLHFQGCTIADLQQKEGDNWNRVPIPINCTMEYKQPIEVKSDETADIQIVLGLFDENSIAAGTYRLDVSASYESKVGPKELNSKSFTVSD